MRARVAWLVLGLAACGGGHDDDWTKRKVAPVSAKVGDVAFTIELPEGMRQKADKDSVEFDFLVGEYAKTPEVTIGVGGFAKTVDEYVKFESKVTNWLRKDTLPDGYVVSYENENYKGKEDYLVYALRTFGSTTLTCSARVTPWDGGATVKDKVPLVEKMCLSLKLN